MELCLERHRRIAGEGILAEIEGKLRTKLKVRCRVLGEYVKLLRQNVELARPEKLDPKTGLTHPVLVPYWHHARYR